MDDIKFRAPAGETYRRKSPFAGLLEHMNKVRECICILKDALTEYYKGNVQKFSEAAKKVSIKDIFYGYFVRKMQFLTMLKILRNL